MQKFIISRMKNSDVDEVFEIEELVHPLHHWSKSSYYGELSNSLAAYFTARESSGRAAGFIGIWKIIDEAHITTLAVHPDFKRMQLGTALMIQIIEECYKNMIKYITLEVRESNTPAIKLYEKFLFAPIGVRKKYYQDNNEDAIIMFTQNIWYDNFKDNFKNIKGSINKITAEYENK